MMQSLPGTTSTAPPSTSFQRAGPSSSSQLLPFFLAQASRLLPSNSTTAPLGGGAPSVGGVRVTCLRMKSLSPLLPENCPSLMTPLQPSPLKVTLRPDASPCRTATGAALGVERRQQHGAVFAAAQREHLGHAAAFALPVAHERVGGGRHKIDRTLDLLALACGRGVRVLLARGPRHGVEE